MITNFLVQHSLSLAPSDHPDSLFEQIFPDSKIFRNYASRYTKTGAIINDSFAPDCRNYLVEHCQTHPFSVGTNGANDTSVKKGEPCLCQDLLHQPF